MFGMTIWEWCVKADGFKLLRPAQRANIRENGARDCRRRFGQHRGRTERRLLYLGLALKTRVSEGKFGTNSHVCDTEQTNSGSCRGRISLSNPTSSGSGGPNYWGELGENAHRRLPTPSPSANPVDDWETAVSSNGPAAAGTEADAVYIFLPKRQIALSTRRTYARRERPPSLVR